MSMVCDQLVGWGLVIPLYEGRPMKPHLGHLWAGVSTILTMTYVGLLPKLVAETGWIPTAACFTFWALQAGCMCLLVRHSGEDSRTLAFVLLMGCSGFAVVTVFLGALATGL